ncbi:MAG: aconitase X [Anaerolineae bacterium]
MQLAELVLTEEERSMLAGEQGRGGQRAMEMVVALARIYGATDLVPIRSAQVAGVSYANIGDAGLEFLGQWADEGARVRVPAMLNPAGMDLRAWQEMGTPAEFAEKQLAVIATYERMGVRPTCTCAPYLLEEGAGLGDHLAWSESSAVAYANSVLGARTNREGGPSALAAAIVGRTGNYGLHLDEGRQPTESFLVRAPLRTVADWGALGAIIGRGSGGVPFIILDDSALEKDCSGRGRDPSAIRSIGPCGRRPVAAPMATRAYAPGENYIPVDPEWRDGLRSLGAAAAATGSVALFHLADVTPEARLGLVRRPRGTPQVIEGLDRGYALLDGEAERLDLVAIGCPHASLEQVQAVAAYLAGKRLAIPLWLMVSRQVAELARERGLAAGLEATGARLTADTCVVVAPLKAMGVRAVATDSAKAACYLPGHQGVQVRFGTLERCLEAALRGKWR